MTYMNRWSVGVGVIVAVLLGTASSAQAQDQQPTTPEFPWSVEFGMGWDRSFSGNINSSAIGRLNNQAVVITKNQYDDVYGTGLHLKGGVGYDLRAARRSLGQRHGGDRRPRRHQPRDDQRQERPLDHSFRRRGQRSILNG